MRWTISCRSAPPPPEWRLANLRFALDQDLTDQRLEGLCQGRIRDVALVLVEFARREEAARRNENLVQLIHYGGFADPE